LNTKFIFRLLLAVFIFATAPDALSQDKRTRRKSKSGQGPSNPYIDKKAKNKPSAKLARSNKKDLKRKNRVIKKQKKALRKKHPH